MGRRPSHTVRERITAVFPVDVRVRDPAFVAELLREGDAFLQMIAEKGRVMYEGSHT